MSRDELKFLLLDVERSARKLLMVHGDDLTTPEMIPISDKLHELIDLTECVRRDI